MGPGDSFDAFDAPELVNGRLLNATERPGAPSCGPLVAPKISDQLGFFTNRRADATFSDRAGVTYRCSIFDGTVILRRVPLQVGSQPTEKPLHRIQTERRHQSRVIVRQHGALAAIGGASCDSRRDD